MPRSLEAGVPEVQHSKRTNPKAVVNNCFTLPVVWGLAAAEREELTQSMQPPSTKSNTSKSTPVQQEDASGTQMATWGSTLSTSCQAHGALCGRPASKTVGILPAQEFHIGNAHVANSTNSTQCASYRSRCLDSTICISVCIYWCQDSRA